MFSKLYISFHLQIQPPLIKPTEREEWRLYLQATCMYVCMYVCIYLFTQVIMYMAA